MRLDLSQSSFWRAAQVDPKKDKQPHKGWKEVILKMCDYKIIREKRGGVVGYE